MDTRDSFYIGEEKRVSCTDNVKSSLGSRRVSTGTTTVKVNRQTKKKE